MSKSWFSSPRLASLSMGLALIVACGADDRPDFDDDPPLTISQPDAGPRPQPEAAPSCTGQRCSPDLRTVLDNCSNEVVKTCDDTQGCFEGGCVPACESAARAQGSLGCEFYTIPPDSRAANAPSCFAAFVANTWTTPVAVQAALGERALDISQSLYRAIGGDGGTLGYERLDTIAPGEVGVLFLSEGPAGPTGAATACPLGVTPAFFGVPVDEHETSRYPAFRLTTDRPVSAYSIFPYGGANSFVPSATLLLPTSSWRSNYVLIDGWEDKQADQVFVQIVSQLDGTEIRVRPNVDIRDGIDVQGGAKGEIATWTLDRGQVLELLQPSSLAGSPLEASHPVAVFGGSQCASLPVASTPACDTLHQQIAPVEQWSTRYSAVPYRSRRPNAGLTVVHESVPYRIVAAASGTELLYDPVRPIGAPATLTTGQAVTFFAEGPFTVRSQDATHPIYAAVYMTGGSSFGSTGDPDFVSLVPDDQFLDSYVFYVDHTYQDSTLTMVRRAGPQGFADVDVDCLGLVSSWQPVGSDGSVEYATLDLTRRGVRTETARGSCDYGRHEAHSDLPFGLYVWGMDDYASYGYAAGAGSRPVSVLPTEVVVH